MMPRSFAVAIAALMLAATAAPCPADPGDTAFFASLYADRRARQPGDIVFVVISESAMASHAASRSNQSSSSVEVGPGTGWLDFIPLLGYGGQLQATAGGQSQRRDMLSARIAATVTGMPSHPGTRASAW